MAQSVGNQIRDFGFGCDLRVMRLSPALGSTFSIESA